MNLGNPMRHRRTTALLTAGLLSLSLCAAMPAMAQGLPIGLLGQIPTTTTGAAKISADTLAFDTSTGTISASGNVEFIYSGFVATGDRVVYNQRSGDVHFVGNVRIRDPQGTEYETTDFKLTGGLKQAFLKSLVIRTASGSTLSAADAEFENELKTVLTDATYSPCGDCVDDKGRTIGWRVRASVIVYDNESETIYLENPKLELLGVPVAWLPYLYLPDPTKRQTGFQFPSIDYGAGIGVKLEVPYFLAVGKDTDLIFTPTLLSKQGFLLGAEVVQRFHSGPLTGVASLKASGIYQLDPLAFESPIGQREWRGAVQTTGDFTPFTDWTAGWSYTAFTDAAYLSNYRLRSGDDLVNEAYVTHLGEDDYFDFRLQQFNLLGNVSAAAQEQQGLALPNGRFDTVFKLAEGFGQVDVSGRLLGVLRAADKSATVNGVPYEYGYAGYKLHGTVEAAWQTRWIAPGGVVATPYLGLRGDAASFDSTSTLNPEDASLYAITPIAAIDLRWPFIGFDGANTHIVEPIIQAVYRGSSVTDPGITNDNAQSFVFDDTNLFSYNRFSGTDRQETGLRLNVGGHYQVDFANGGYLDLIAGQSFHLAGVNAFSVGDQVNTGAGSGLEDTASYLVLGAKSQIFKELKVGAKLQIDSSDWNVRRATAVLGYANEWGYTLDADYVYIPAGSAAGVIIDQHEIGAIATVPIMDYWYVNGGLRWDLVANTWVKAQAGVKYDDKYLSYGFNYSVSTPVSHGSYDHRFTVGFGLKGPDGINFSF
ncbi:MAG: LPS-assembly protein LptD [Devosia sp.]|nr:LPS-assembly protein LptD [Devosia sp.]